MMRKMMFLVALAGATFAVGSRALSSSPTTVAGDDQSGKTLYARYGCFQCHGYAGQGSVLSGPALANRKLPPDFIVQYVRSPAGVMPGYSQRILSDTALRAIALHVQSLNGGPPAAQIPPLARFKKTN